MALMAPRTVVWHRPAFRSAAKRLAESALASLMIGFQDFLSSKVMPSSRSSSLSHLSLAAWISVVAASLKNYSSFSSRGRASLASATTGMASSFRDWNSETLMLTNLQVSLNSQ